jgi:hypothetical protein
MENKIESNNSIGATNKNILIPSGSQLLLYFLMAVVLLVALNIKNAWDYLNKTVLIPEGGIDSIITTHAPSLHKILNSISQSIILQVVFWVFVGCGVYVIIWFIKNIAINLLNDITADQYVHPHAYKRYRFWTGIIGRRLFFWITALVLVAYLSVSARLLFYLAGTCYDAVANFDSYSSLLVIGESLLSVTGLIYIGVLLIHIAMSSWQLMYKDL